MSEYKVYDPAKESLDFDFKFNSEETKSLFQVLEDHEEKLDEDFVRRVALWKYNRIINLSEDALALINSVKSSTGIKVGDKLFENAIKTLTNSDGIGYPLASAILKFLQPDVFPIIDVRAYRALKGKKIYSSTYTYERYLDYCNDIHELASKLNRPLREIDQQLYEYDKKFNGTIS